MVSHTQRGARTGGQAPAASLPSHRRGALGRCSGPRPRRPLHGPRSTSVEVAERAAAAHAEERPHARANGNGLANGRANGHSNSNGRTNGLSNGNGLANGRANGNGKASGLANGTANGLSNGRANGKAHGAEPVSHDQQPEAPAPPAEAASPAPAAAEPGQPADPPSDPDGHWLPVYDGVAEVRELSAPIVQCLGAKRRVPLGMFSAFARGLLKLQRREQYLSGPTIAHALHRLAVAREGCGMAPTQAHKAFLICLGRVGKASHGMEPKELALSVWATVKFAEAEGYRLPPYVPPERRRSAEPSAAGQAQPGGGVAAEADSEQTAAGEASDGSTSSVSPLGSPREQGAAEAPAAAAAAPTGSLTAPPRRSQLNRLALERLSSHSRAESLHPSVAREARGARSQQRWLPLKAHDRLGKLAAIWLSKMKRCDAGSLCLMLWAFARLGSSPLDGKLFALSQTRALPLLQQFNGQDVPNFLWAFAELKEPLEQEVLDAVSRRGISLVDGGDLRPISIAIAIQSLGRMGRDPLGGDFVDAMLRRLIRRRADRPAYKHLRFLTAESLTSVWVGLAALRHAPSEEFAEMWAGQCVRRAGELSAEQLVAVEQASASLGLDPLGGKLLRVLRRELKAREADPLAGPPPVRGLPPAAAAAESLER